MGGAVRFLTIIPVPGEHRPPTRAALVAFPIVGILIGLVWTSVAATDRLFPNTFMVAALILVADAVVTGALHLDGLADALDGLASRRPAEEAIAIMRQGPVGAVGALGLVLVCLVRLGALVGLLGFPQIPWALVLPPAAGRAGMVLLLALVPARTDGSLAGAVARPNGNVVVAVSLVSGLVAGVLDLRCLVLLAAGYGVVVAFGAGWRHRFGDLSGDAAGACGLLVETVVLVGLAVLGILA